ncbi:MAG: TetR/AcrR family transcriptional regulator [Leucobacter sp.]
MATKPSDGADASGEQRLRDAARALADAAGQLGQSLGGAGAQAETGVTKGLLAAAQALAQASAWVEQRARPLSTKEKLLEQAIRLFAERGYAGVSLEDIAQAAGFTKGAVYSHFGSKEQTFLAALRSAAEELAGLGLEGPAEKGAAESGSAPDGAQAESQRLAQAVTLTLEAMLFGQRTPDRREEVRAIVAELIAALAAAERRLSDAGLTQSRVLDRDESEVAELALRTLLLGLTPDEGAGGPSWV